MKAHEFIHEMQTTSAILGRSSGLRVVFEGDGAKTNGETIWLPALPHQVDLTVEQVNGMRGYVDHEAGHNRHTDMPRVMSFYDKNMNNNRPDLNPLHNALEDVWMEERVMEEYPGSHKNLRQSHELVRRSEYKSFSKDTPEAQAGKAKWAAQPNETAGAAITYNKNENFKTEHNEKMRGILDSLAPGRDEMGAHWAQQARDCTCTEEVIELAKRVYQYNEQTATEDQSPKDFDDKAQAGDLSGLEGEEAEGANSKGFQEGKGNQRFDMEGKPIQVMGGQDADPDKIGVTLTDPDDADHGGGGIGSCMDNGLRSGYKVASTEGDKYYKRGVPMIGGSEHIRNVINDVDNCSSHYDQRKMELRSDVMVMKNKLRRALMARQQRDWDFGREYGRLDTKRLVSAYLGNPAVYKRRIDREEDDTAISILIDLSGSMYGQKAEVARDCAIALSECFEGTQMRYRIAGFNNNSHGGVLRKARDEYPGKYHRYARTDHAIFKDFDDALRVMRGTVYSIPKCVSGNNSDYDYVNRELYDLSRRTEDRKVLFVLSDGHVATMSDAPSDEHNRLIRENLKYYKGRFGVESVGLGIMDGSVKDIYPDWVRVDSANELATTCFHKMTNILFKEKGY